eukprot:ANDGO_02474.mRNA.1 Serine/threonine-protein kinase BCK1/SLK1/SSP31
MTKHGKKKKNRTSIGSSSSQQPQNPVDSPVSNSPNSAGDFPMFSYPASPRSPTLESPFTKCMWQTKNIGGIVPEVRQSPSLVYVSSSSSSASASTSSGLLYIVGGYLPRRPGQRLTTDSISFPHLVGMTGASPSQLSAILGHACLTTGKKAFLLGGRTADHSERAFPVVHAFDFQNPQWVHVEPDGISPPPRLFGAIASDSNASFVYMCGGFMLTTVFPMEPYEFHIASQTWRKLPINDKRPLPSPRIAFSMVLFDNYLYIWGGWDPVGKVGLKDMWRFPLDYSATRQAQEWEKVTPSGLSAPPALAYHSTTLVAGRYMVIFGGAQVDLLVDEKGHRMQELRKSNRTYAFDLEQMNWFEIETIGPCPVARMMHGAVLIPRSALPDLMKYSGTASFSGAEICDEVLAIWGGDVAETGLHFMQFGFLSGASSSKGDAALFASGGRSSIRHATSVDALSRSVSMTSISQHEEFVQLLTNYTEERVLGKGAFGEVRLVQHNDVGLRMAVKVVSKLERYEEEVLSKYVKVPDCQSVNIIRCLGLKTEGEMRMVFMEYMAGGSLKDLLVRNTRILPERACQYLLHVARGLLFLHNQKIVHRDLKLDNILLDDNGIARIGDFGTAYVFGLQLSRSSSGAMLSSVSSYKTSPSDSARRIVGTVTHLAPEAVDQRVEYAMDIFSFGCMAVEMLTGQSPLMKRIGRIREDAAAILTLSQWFGELASKCPPGVHPPELCTTCWDGPTDADQHIPPKLVELIQSCLRIHPENRPSAADLCESLSPMANGSFL